MLSTGQINDAFQQALGRAPTGSELAQYSNNSSLDGSAGQQTLISQLGGSSGSSSSGTGPSAQDIVAQYVKQATDTTAAAEKQYEAGVSAYDAANPFNFDDMLAKETANASPYVSAYYNQQLNDFMNGVNMTRQHSIEDTQRQVNLLQADQDAYTGQAKQQLNTALLQAGQQYSDAGSYDSGARARAQGVQEANTAYDVAQNARQSNYDIGTANIANQRLLGQTIPYETSIENQQIARGQSADTQNLATQNYNYDYAQNQYNRQHAGVANIQANGNNQAAGALPGDSSAQTSQFLSGLLPNVSSSPVAPIYQTSPASVAYTG